MSLKSENNSSFLVENCDSGTEFVAKKAFPLVDATIGRVDRKLQDKFRGVLS